MRALITGGVRSGKSRHAESLLQPPYLPADAAVTYLACGPQRDDTDWAARVADHQARRPESWSTVESTDAAGVLAASSGPILVECLGTWLTGQLDALDAWESEESRWSAELDRRVDALVAAWESAPHAIAVTNEVGWGVVPAYRSGRLFADRLGMLNQRLATSADRVDLVVSGAVLTVKGAQE